MTLGGGKNAGGFAIGLSEMAIGGACDQAACLVHLLHPLQQGGEALGRQRQTIPKRCKRASPGRFGCRDHQQETGDQRFRFLVPVGIPR